MTLADYLTKTQLSDAEFARRIGKSRQDVQRYRSEGRIPSPETMQKIAEETEGEVMPNDFFGLAA